MYLALILLCLNSFLVPILFGRHLGYLGTSIFTTISMLLCNFCSFFILYEVTINGSCCYLPIFNWIYTGLLDVDFIFQYDELTSLMLVVVTSISMCTHLYSISYMHGDPHHSRFMAYLSLFTWFMIILVTSSNFLQLFLGWEGVGICSFLLINFWYTRLQANKSAIKAMLTNKVSDLCLTVGMFMLFSMTKSLDFSINFCLLMNNENYYYYMELINFLILVGAVGKSAQLFLHIWLPDAMEGPTPVSSLIHAATMVTAGIFLVIRTSYLFEYSNNNMLIIILLGSLTAFFSSITGLFQNDIKKVIAYSTCSQLGYMFFICGFSKYHLSFFHLFNHAFFKALLFLTAGCLIHSINNEQDIRNMGGFSKLFPSIYVILTIGSISLMGLPFTTGFYSKDMILEGSYNHMKGYNYLSIDIIHSLYWVLVISVVFTSLYSLRVIFTSFINSFNGYLSIIKSVHHPDLYLLIPLVYLSLFSLFVGYITKDLIVGLGTPIWDKPIHNLFFDIDFEFYNFIYKIIPLILSFYSIVLIIITYNFMSLFIDYLKLTPTGHHIYLYLNQKWFFDKLINDLISQFLYKVSFNVYLKVFDKGYLELFGPFGITMLIRKALKIISESQSGLLYHYIGVALNIVVYLIIIYITFLFFI